jgi:hypothetical protein
VSNSNKKKQLRTGGYSQGDQIQRSFACWVIFFLWAIFLITEVAQIFWLLFSTEKDVD